MKVWGKCLFLTGLLFPTLLLASQSFEPIEYDASQFKEVHYVRVLLAKLVERDQGSRKGPEFRKCLEVMKLIDAESTGILKELK